MIPLLLILIKLIDISEIKTSITLIESKTLLTLVLLQFTTILLVNLQWYTLAFALGTKISFRSLLHINMVGTFVESITPSLKAGGELSKIAIIKKQDGYNLGKATALVGVQKVISMFSFLLINFIGLIFFSIILGKDAITIKSFISSFSILLGLFLILLSLLMFPDQLFKKLYTIPWLKIRKEKIEIKIYEVKTYTGLILKRKRILAWQTLLSLTIWMLFAFKAFIIGNALYLDLGILPIAFVSYTSYMAGMLPILPGGLGTFEGTSIILLSTFGISNGNSLTFTLLFRFITFWMVFLISCIYLVVNIIYFYFNALISNFAFQE